MSTDRRSFASLLAELKRRRVFRAAAVYAVVAWMVVEVAATTFPLLQLPAWAPRLVLALALLGFPVALVLAWALELTPEGIRRTTTEATSSPGRGHTRWGFAVAAVALAVIGVAAYARLRPGAASDPVAIHSIAVLPFVDMSANGDQEYFSDGISEELLDALANVPGLQVTARTSSFQFKDRSVDIRDIGRRLNVDAVLEGSVRRSADRVRITAQLIKADDGFHLWSQTYDRHLTDIFQIQDEISGAIVQSLRARLGGSSPATSGRHAGENLQAYEAYLKARHRLQSARDATTFTTAVDEMERAARIDPRFPLPRVELAAAHLLLARVRPPIPEIAKARAAAQSALALDDQLAEAYEKLAEVAEYEFRWDEAGDLYRKSIALNPTLVAACKCYGMHLLIRGRTDDAIRELERARALDPVSGDTYGYLAMAYFHAGRLDDTRSAIRDGLALDTGSYMSRMVAAWLARREGRYDEALRHLIGEGSPDSIDITATDPMHVAEIGFTLARGGHRAEALKVLARMEEQARADYFPAVWIAAVHGALGNDTAASAWLQRAFLEKSADLSSLAISTVREPLRDLPAYRELMRKIGLGEGR